MLVSYSFDPEEGGNKLLEMTVDFYQTTWRYIPEA
jgi:hypothetical protein